MPQKILSPNLYPISRIFSLPQGLRGVELLETEAPIQLVFDVSRLAELSRIETAKGAAGFFQLGSDVTFAAAESQESLGDPYASLDATWGEAEERWCWLWDTCVLATDTDISTASISVAYPALGAAFAQRDYPVRVYDAVSAEINDAGSFPIALLQQTKQPGIRLPILVPRGTAIQGGTVRFRGTSTAATTVRWQALIWVGPIGVYPPGLA